MRMVDRVAGHTETVLITGETGTGKELIARTIHKASHRRSRPWVDINCAALPENLVESELFGYEKGAFTGADVSKPGLFELADRGTLFLDEIGELQLHTQVKLLRVLDGYPFYRLGGHHKIKVDVRIVAATNQDLVLRDLVGIEPLGGLYRPLSPGSFSSARPVSTAGATATRAAGRCSCIGRTLSRPQKLKQFLYP